MPKGQRSWPASPILPFFFLLDRVLHISGWRQTYYVAKDDLELPILLSHFLAGVNYHTLLAFCGLTGTWSFMHARIALCQPSYLLSPGLPFLDRTEKVQEAQALDHS